VTHRLWRPAFLIALFYAFVAFAGLAYGQSHPVAVVLIRLGQSSQMPTLAREAAAEWAFRSPTGLAAYYRAASYGQYEIVGDAYGWFDVDDGTACAGRTALVNAYVAAADPIVDWARYERAVFVVAGREGTCLGAGNFGLRMAFETRDGPVSLGVVSVGICCESSGYTSITLPKTPLIHEFGHTLGLAHAGHVWCSGTEEPIAPNGVDCGVSEYHDGYSTMGGIMFDEGVARNGDLAAPHREYLGWLREGDGLQTVTASGRYVLAPLRQVSGLRALKIRRGIGDYLYAEYRQPGGFDAFLVGSYYAQIVRGALLHIINPYPDRPTTATLTPRRTGLLNMNLGVPGQLRGESLPVGKSWTDPDTGTTLNVVSASPTGLTVDVTLGKTDFTPPVVTWLRPPHRATIKGEVEVALDAGAATGIGAVEFFGRQRTAWWPPNNFNYGTSTPVGTGPTMRLDTTRLRNGPLGLHARVADCTPVGQPNVTTTGLYSFTVANIGDTEPPMALFLSPATASRTSPIPVFKVDASDNLGIDRVEFYQDAELLPYAVDFKPPFEPQASAWLEGPHEIRARALDLQGNPSERRLAFSADSTVPVATYFPEPGSYPYPVDVVIGVPLGFTARYTTDGSAPLVIAADGTCRFGATAIAAAQPAHIARSSTLRLGGMLGQVCYPGGDVVSYTIAVPLRVAILAPTTISVRRGKSITASVSVVLLAGTAAPVEIGITGTLPGVSASTTPAACTPPCVATLTLKASAAASKATGTLFITATNGPMVERKAVSVQVR